MIQSRRTIKFNHLHLPYHSLTLSRAPELEVASAFSPSEQYVLWGEILHSHTPMGWAETSKPRLNTFRVSGFSLPAAHSCREKALVGRQGLRGENRFAPCQGMFPESRWGRESLLSHETGEALLRSCCLQPKSGGQIWTSSCYHGDCKDVEDVRGIILR